MSSSRGWHGSCEDQELHRSGAVQPHGALLVRDRRGTVTHASANLAEFTAWDHRSLLGNPLPAQLDDLLASLPDAEGERIYSAMDSGAASGELDVTMSRSAGGEAVLELVRAQSGRVPRSLSAGCRYAVPDEHELDHQRAELVRHVGEVGGFNRVMYCQFLPGGDGVVLDEYRSEAVTGTYLDLRFPASEIPMVVRQLYVRNPWRSVSDAGADPVPLVGHEERPADLSYADLRSVARTHRACMRNMGVAASVSFPLLTSGGELMALLTCHRQQAGPVPLETLQHFHARVAAFNLALRTLLTHERMRMLDQVERQAAEVGALARQAGEGASLWPRLMSWLMRSFDADGVAVCAGDRIAGRGTVPESEALMALDQWFTDDRDDLVLATDSLARLAPQLPPTDVAGVLALRLGAPMAEEGVRLYVCRSEHVHEVAWGGSPDMPEETLHDRPPISPRRSFERWVETRLGFSRPWPAHVRLKLLKVRAALQQELAA